MGAGLAIVAASAAERLIPPPAARDVVPLPRAHAHNDYEHARPLLDALDHGFCSVEADIHLVNGALLVAHDRDQVRPDRTLEALYLRPLSERVRRFHGSVYPGGPPFTLLVDIKADAEGTYRVLRKLLARYAHMLTRFTADSIETNAVTIILSGARPTQTVAQEPARYVAIDGRLPDLERNAPVSLIPLVSDSWWRTFRWRGTPPMPEAERAQLRALVQKAHQTGRRIRFWAVPDKPEAWAELYDAGVDLINTDHLAELAKFLRARMAKPSQ